MDSIKEALRAILPPGLADREPPEVDQDNEPCLGDGGDLRHRTTVRLVERSGRKTRQCWIEPPDLSPCQRCHAHGSGMTLTRDERGYEFVRRCEGGRMVEAAELFNRARIPAKFVDARSRPLVPQIWDDVGRPDWKPGDRGWWLAGSAGIGKSWGAAAALRRVIGKHRARGEWVHMARLQGDIRASYSDPQYPGEREVLDRLCSLDVLVIDEICHSARRGAGEIREFELRLLEELIDRRNEARLTTWCTSNYAPEDLRRCGGVEVGRVVSRMCDVEWMHEPVQQATGYDARRLPFMRGEVGDG